MHSPLYKYMEVRHVESFMEGRILLSRSDRHKLDGKLTSTQALNEEVRESEGGVFLMHPKDAFPGAIISEQPITKVPPGWEGIRQINLKSTVQREAERHYWLWCASKRGDAQLAPCYNADAIVRIDNPSEFRARLMQAVSDQFPPDGMQGCVVGAPMRYSNMPFMSPNDVEAAFHHHENQRFQQEYRIAIFGDTLIPRHEGPEPLTAYVYMGDNYECCTTISDQLLGASP